MNPKWAKGYSRKGAALHGLEDFEGAIAAYEEGLKLEPGNAQCKKVQRRAELPIHDIYDYIGYRRGQSRRCRLERWRWW